MFGFAPPPRPNIPLVPGFHMPPLQFVNAPPVGGAGMQAPMQMPGGGGFGGLGMGINNNVNRTIPEGNVSGFPIGGGPQGPSGGSLAPDNGLGTTQPGGFWNWLKGLF